MSVLLIITNVAHLIFYCVEAHIEWDYSCTDYEDYVPIPDKYQKYFPYFDMFQEISDYDVMYEYRCTSTPIGKYLYMDTACADTGIYFIYEEI